MLTQHFNILYCLVFRDDITIIQRENTSFRNGGPFSVEQTYKCKAIVIKLFCTCIKVVLSLQATKQTKTFVFVSVFVQCPLDLATTLRQRGRGR